MSNALVKWPRQYAAEIAAEKSIEKRRALLESVPEYLRGMVEFHVRNGWLQRMAA